jgi:hypothetical protein
MFSALVVLFHLSPGWLYWGTWFVFDTYPRQKYGNYRRDNWITVFVHSLYRADYQYFWPDGILIFGRTSSCSEIPYDHMMHDKGLQKPRGSTFLNLIFAARSNCLFVRLFRRFWAEAGIRCPNQSTRSSTHSSNRPIFRAWLRQVPEDPVSSVRLASVGSGVAPRERDP